MGNKTKLFSVTLKDCKVQTFTVGGHGGSGKDTSNTGVRIIHPPSGARGECREERSQFKNKQIAFKRMAESQQFRAWCRFTAAKMKGIDIEKLVDEWTTDDKLLVEFRDKDGKWEPENSILVGGSNDQHPHKG